MTTYIVDLETNGLLPELHTIHCLCTRNTVTGVAQSYYDTPPPAGAAPAHGTIAEGVASLKGHIWAGHNLLGFDIPALLKLGYKPEPELVFDTLVASRLIFTELLEFDYHRAAGNQGMPKKLFGRHSLEAWGYRLDLRKGDFAKTTDWATFTLDMLAYCLQDTAVNLNLLGYIERQNWPGASLELESQFANEIEGMTRTGVCFDSKAADALLAELMVKRAALETTILECPEFAPFSEEYETPKKKIRKTRVTVFNPRSRDHIAKALMTRCGWKPVVFTETGKPKVDETVLKAIAIPAVRNIERHLLIQKRIGQLAEGAQAWMRVVKPDGRIHAFVNHNGAVTGRCTHSGPNLSAVPHVLTEKIATGLAVDGVLPVASFPKLGLRGGFGFECRALFVPQPGWVLVGADAAGLELRCLAHFMARHDGGAYVKVILNGDIHNLTMEALGITDRDQAKTFIYAFLYGAGAAKLGAIVGGGDARGRELKARFLKQLPAIQGVIDDIISALVRRKMARVYFRQGVRHIQLLPGAYILGLDGRKLYLRSDYAALNTLLQSAGALVMKRATIIVCAALRSLGIPFNMVLHVHDEFQIETPAEYADLVGKGMVSAIQAAGVHFNFRCPLDGQYRIGKSWAETH